ncbi:SCO family protein [Methylibium rhizosphaerae]|uniref:SCO family protein n=1 Tax=Methylibium rhizosphaerae TaxID=2570323 RepID=UPI001129AE88|nr:SCO family protein [Methylibium rhizosphaerae]
MTLLDRRVFALGALAALAGCKPMGGSDGPKGAFKAVDITGADYAKDFSLPDVDGKVRTIADFKGKAVLVFFGFAQCPDVCPTTMAELAQVKKQLGADGERIQGVFITVDPERDTPEVLKGYVQNFDPSFVALRGTPEQTLAAAKAFKIFYEKVPGKTPGSYTVNHTAASYVFDPQGRVRLYVRYGSGPDALAADFRQLLQGA